MADTPAPSTLRRGAELLAAHWDGNPEDGHQRGDHEDDALPDLIAWLYEQADTGGHP
jgi:hypothetical protein